MARLKPLVARSTIWRGSPQARAGSLLSTVMAASAMLATRRTCRYARLAAPGKLRSHHSFSRQMIIDFEHHYIPAELGRRFGIDPARKDAVKAGDATVHAR